MEDLKEFSNLSVVVKLIAKLIKKAAGFTRKQIRCPDWAWKLTPVIPVPRRMRQEDSHKFERLCSEFKDSLSSKSDPV